MNTRRWIFLFTLAAALLALLSILLLRSGKAEIAEVWLDGVCIEQLPLSIDTELTVRTPDGGWNRIVVSGGTISVADADCPDQVCVLRGPVRGGAPIVCLPHQLVIRFQQSTNAIDGVAG